MDGIVDLDATIPAIPPLPKAMTLWEVMHNRRHAAAAVYVGLLGLSPDPALAEWIAARAGASGHAEAFQLLGKEWQRRVANRGELLAQVGQLLRELGPDEKRQLLATVKRVTEQASVATWPASHFFLHVRALFDALPVAQPTNPMLSAQDVDTLLALVAAHADCSQPSEEKLQAARAKAATELHVQPLRLRPAPAATVEIFEQLVVRLSQRQASERNGIVRAAVMVAAELEGASWSAAEQADSRLPALSQPTAELLHALHAALGIVLRPRPAGWPRRA